MPDITIVCYGDSITYGYCAEYGKDYVSLFKNKVKEDFPEASIIIKKRGENGETSRDGLKRLDAHILSYKTDMVIMLFGSNDSAYNIWQHVGIEEFSYNYDMMLSVMKKSCIKAVLITPPPVIEDEEYPFIENDVLNKYCELIRKKAELNALPLVDMNRAFSEKGNLKALLQWDGVHISTEGYQLFFDTVYETVKPLIEDMLKDMQP